MRDVYVVGVLRCRLSIVIVVVDSSSAVPGPGVTKGRAGTIGHDVLQGAHFYHSESSSALIDANYTAPFVVPRVGDYPVPRRLLT